MVSCKAASSKAAAPNRHSPAVSKGAARPDSSATVMVAPFRLVRGWPPAPGNVSSRHQAPPGEDTAYAHHAAIGADPQIRRRIRNYSGFGQDFRLAATYAKASVPTKR